MPATVTVYRRLGYEYAGIYTEYRVPLRDLPRAEGVVPVEELGRNSTEAVKDCFRRFAAQHNGVADSDEELWWNRRVHMELSTDSVTRLVGVPGSNGLDGYAAFELKGEGDWGYRVASSHLVSTTAVAGRALLGYFRRYASFGTELSWLGPPNEPLALMLPEQSLKAHWQFRFMSRLLDVPAALEARGYPDVQGEAVVAIEDDLFPENRGPWRIEADAGKVRVSPADAAAGRPVPIGAFTSLFAGYLSPFDLVRIGALDRDDAAVQFLGRLFAGPPPWMPDFF